MAEYSQTYWNELIDQYRNGNISDQDRFQLEKQALDDPFLFDALEGFALHENVMEENVMGEISEEKAAIKIFTLPRLAAAASIILLVAFMYNLKQSQGSEIEKNPMAMVLDKEEATEDPKEKKTSGINSMVSSSSETVESQEEVVISANDQKSEKIAKKESPKTNTETNRDTPAKVNVPSVSEPKKDLVEVQEKPDVVVAGENIDTQDEILTAAEDIDFDRATEDVVDVSGANNLESGVEKQDEKLVIPVESDSDSKRLEEETSKKRKVSLKNFYEAVPVIGKEIFDDYARERIDKRGLRQDKPQEVTIEFTIDENGNLSDFHHIFTGCPECGPFAISVLQNSGEWKTIPPGFSGKARYTFIF